MKASGCMPAGDRRQDLHLEMPGVTQELAPRPEQAGMHDDGHHRHLEIAVEAGNAVFVIRRRAGGAAGAFRVDDELTAAFDLALGAFKHLGHDLALGPAIDRDHPHLENILAEKRDPAEFALENVDRVVKPGQQRVGVPERLMLGRKDVAAFGDVLEAFDFECGADDLCLQPVIGQRPVFSARSMQPCARPENNRARTGSCARSG